MFPATPCGRLSGGHAAILPFSQQNQTTLAPWIKAGT